MDFVFVTYDLLSTPVTNLEGTVLFDIKTATPPGRMIPVTRIERLDRVVPLDSSGCRALVSTGSQDQVTKIHWEGLGSPTIVYSSLLKGTGGKGVLARRLLKRRNLLSLSKRCQFFIGNDGLKYRWKIIASLGCTLTRNHQEVGRCTRRLITEGIFVGHTKFVLHVEPECSTLDVGMMIMTFLIVDHKRQQKENGPLRYAPTHDEDPGDGEGESAEGDNGNGNGATEG